MFKRYLITYSLLFLIFRTGSLKADEQRCTDLGSACSCNETLDATGYINEGQSATVVAFDPTGDGNTKRCGKYQGMQVQRGVGGTPTGEINFISETGMPQVNAVSKVYRQGHADASVVIPGNSIQDSTRRLCWRHYIRMSPNYDGGDITVNPSSPNCSGGKFMHFGFDGNYQIGMSSAGCMGRQCDVFLGVVVSAVSVWDNAPGMNENKSIPSDIDFNYSDCYGQWCRMETCVSGNFATGTGDFFLEGYVKRLSDGKQRNWPRFNLGAGKGSSMLVPQWVWANVDGYAGYSNESIGCTNGSPSDRANEWREYSHVMQAEWTIDQPGLFIGKAFEVEGGTGTTPNQLSSPGIPKFLSQAFSFLEIFKL